MASEVAIAPKSRSIINATTTASYLDAACFTCTPASAVFLLFFLLLLVIIVIIMLVTMRIIIITIITIIAHNLV